MSIWRAQALGMAAACLEARVYVSKSGLRSGTASQGIQKSAYGLHSVAVQASACIKAGVSMREVHAGKQEYAMITGAKMMPGRAQPRDVYLYMACTVS